MLSGKMFLTASAGFVLPNNFIDKIAVSENLIEKNFHIMHAVPVKMNPNRSVLCEQILYKKQPGCNHLKIIFHAFFPHILVCKVTDFPASAHCGIGNG